MNSFLQSALPLSGVSLTENQIRDFERYEEALLEWNRRYNLTAITAREDIRTKHFLDSLSCLKVMPLRPGMRVVDIGTGAGFPGIPLKIAAPDIRLTLVESIRKKADFCRYLAGELQLREVTILNARAEDIGQDPSHREQYHWAVARAVADLCVLAEYLFPLVQVGGYALAQKGGNGPAEAHAAAGALRLLGGEVEKVVPIELPGIAEARYLIVMRKNAATPPQYPRRAGTPSKKPLGGRPLPKGKQEAHQDTELE